VTELGTSELIEITGRTLGVCFTALFIALGLGIPTGIWLGRRSFVGRRALLGLVNSGMGAPPVVVGLLVAQLFFRSGPLGHLELWYSPSTRIGSCRSAAWASPGAGVSGCCCARSASACSPR
jgi:ABC-type tungstate transport system substrate-binding protein